MTEDSTPTPTPFSQIWTFLKFWSQPPKIYHPRIVEMFNGKVKVITKESNMPSNITSITKYTLWNFVPLVIYNQFKIFFNLYFLFVAISQTLPILRITYLMTSVMPLLFVLCITMAKEAYDDIQRWNRSREVNSQLYSCLTTSGITMIMSSDIKVGDLIEVSKDQRVPADLIFLRTTEKTGSSFIRTDQLDGETDWKLRKAISCTQRLGSDSSLVNMDASILIEKPHCEIYEFVGLFTQNPHLKSDSFNEPIGLENTIWANTVVASGTIIGLVAYTGKDTKNAMNTSHPKSKLGKLDLEINNITKYLCLLLVVISFILVMLNRFQGLWAVSILRFIILFSSIIPISLRVNLDLSRMVYSYFIAHDPKIPGAVVRNSTIPEELGRVGYLLTDKTGTLTRNDMVFKRLHIGIISYSHETLDDIVESLAYSYGSMHTQFSAVFHAKRQQELSQRLRDAITGLAICNNVTPIYDELNQLSYQASSPDEVALVRFTERVGLTLVARDLHSLTLHTPSGTLELYDFLQVFPFTSETKRMGIIVCERVSGKITFYLKGADSVMLPIVNQSEWLEEECVNMARDGLRTLVFGKRHLDQTEYNEWLVRYNEARTAIVDRRARTQSAVEELEHDLQLIGLTGVEDKLQRDVKHTLERLRNAGIRIWMLTGDKVETAKCIAISARLVSRQQRISTLFADNTSDAHTQLMQISTQKDTALILDGKTLEIFLTYLYDQFAEVACHASAVICCRCSPSQKAQVVTLVRSYTNTRTCAIGDGGNDVSMIQAADVGLGIVGKEGRQASLAADYSLLQFSHISHLLLWHGRNSYKRSARLAQFIIHRGLVISTIQAIFSAIFYFSPVSIYAGWLLVCYPTLFTILPIFSLVLDEDVSQAISLQYPELYHELQKGRSLNMKTFLIWVFISIYQGGMIMMLAVLFFDSSLHSIVTITYTTLIFAQLLNVAFEINKWHWMMIVGEVLSVAFYIIFAIIFRGYVNIQFMATWDFSIKILAMTVIATVPIYLLRFIKRRCDPPSYSKV